MQLELDKYGINMPSFGKIGGILANEVMVVGSEGGGDVTTGVVTTGD